MPASLALIYRLGYYVYAQYHQREECVEHSPGRYRAPAGVVCIQLCKGFAHGAAPDQASYLIVNSMRV